MSRQAASSAFFGGRPLLGKDPLTSLGQLIGKALLVGQFDGLEGREVSGTAGDHLIPIRPSESSHQWRAFHERGSHHRGLTLAGRCHQLRKGSIRPFPDRL